MAILTIAISFAGQAKDKSNITIPFEVINGLTIIQAEVDGIHGRYLLDTGSDGIFIDGVAEENTQNSIVSLGGSSSIEIQELKEVRVGTYSQTNLEAQIISLQPIEDHLGIDLKGIIGGYLFQPKVVTLDFKNSILTLSDKLQKGEKAQFENKISINTINQIPIAKIKIENNWYQFALDSGSSIHFVDTEILNQLSNVSDTNETSTMKCLANTNSKLDKQRIDSFSLGNVDFKNQTCLPRSFTDLNASTGVELDGVLSISQLAQDKVVIDYTRSKLYF